MTKSWAPPTACQMRCKDCGSDLPHRTYYHACDGTWRRQPITTFYTIFGKSQHVAGIARVGRDGVIAAEQAA